MRPRPVRRPSSRRRRSRSRPDRADRLRIIDERNAPVERPGRFAFAGSPCFGDPDRNPENEAIETDHPAAAGDGARDLIRRHFPLAAVETLPGIVLHRAGPASGLWRLAEKDPAFGTPYWAYEWGGGLALARHVIANPECVAGRRVVDVGTGSGLVAIAAARAGAVHVLAVDVDPYAILAARLNAEANGVTIETRIADILPALPAPSAEVVLIGDLFYDDDIAPRTLAFAERCVAAGLDVLIGDPDRAPLPRHRLREIARYPGGDFGTRAATSEGGNAVYTLDRAS